MRDILKSYDLPLAVALSGVRRRMGSDHRSVKDEPFEAGGEIELAGTHLISFLIVNRINQAGKSAVFICIVFTSHRILFVFRVRILVQVTIYRRILSGRDGHLDQS